MAGGVAKGIGVALIILGVLILIAGAAAAIYGAQAESDNQGSLVANDNESQENEVIMAAGLAAVGLGIVLLAIGIVSVVAGASRNQKFLLQEVAAMKAESSNDENAPALEPKSGTAAVPPPRDDGQMRKAATIAGIVVVVALAGFLLTMIGGGGVGLFDESQPRLIQEDNLAGTVRMAGPFGTLDQSGDNVVRFTVPSDTATVVIVINWTAVQGGAEKLTVLVDRYDGAWETMQTGSGTSTLEFTLDDPTLAGQDLRVVVTTGEENTVAVEQPFGVDIGFWDDGE